MVQTYYLQWGWECLLILFFLFWRWYVLVRLGTSWYVLVRVWLINRLCLSAVRHITSSPMLSGFRPYILYHFLCVHFCSGLLSSCDAEDAGVSAACSERCPCSSGCQSAFHNPDTALYCANSRKVLRWLQESPTPRKPGPTRRGQIQFFTTIRTKQIFRLFGLRCSS